MNAKKKSRRTSWPVDVIYPTGHGLSQGGRHGWRSNDGQRNVTVFLAQQLLGDGFSVGVSIGTFAYQSTNQSKEKRKHVSFLSSKPTVYVPIQSWTI